MSRLQKRLEQINSKVTITQVLFDYGYRIHMGGEFQEQQFQCDLHGDGRDGTPSARMYPATNSWYCISEDDRVLTSSGWLKLRDTNELVLAIDGTGKWCHPIAHVARGTRDTVILKTKEGYSVTATPDHEVWFYDGPCTTINRLKVGDKIDIVVPELTVFPTDTRLPIAVDDINLYNPGRKHNHLSLPSTWSHELGEALGYVFGDGWITDRPGGSSMVGLTSHFNDASEARSVFAYLRSICGGGGSESHKTGLITAWGKVYRENQVSFTIGSDGLREFFVRLGMGKEEVIQKRRLPWALWTAPEVAVRGFLRGVFATDGAVFKPRNRSTRVSLYSVSCGFLTDVQMLLLQFGIRCRVYQPSHNRSCGMLQISSGHDVELFRQRVGISIKRKQDVLDRHEYNPSVKRRGYATVASVEPAGAMVVADLSMPFDPSFCAGGIRVHNCFACSKSRGIVDTVIAKEKIEFINAVALVESRYKLPQIPFGDDDDWHPGGKPDNPAGGVVSYNSTFASAYNKMLSSLGLVTEVRTLPMDTILVYWEAVDNIAYQAKSGAISDQSACKAMHKMHERLIEALQHGNG